MNNEIKRTAEEVLHLIKQLTISNQSMEQWPGEVESGIISYEEMKLICEVAQAYLQEREWISVEKELPTRKDKYPVIRFVHEDGGWWGRNFAFWDGEMFRENGTIVLWMDAPMPDPLPPEPEQ